MRTAMMMNNMIWLISRMLFLVCIQERKLYAKYLKSLHFQIIRKIQLQTRLPRPLFQNIIPKLQYILIKLIPSLPCLSSIKFTKFPKVWWCLFRTLMANQCWSPLTILCHTQMLLLLLYLTLQLSLSNMLQLLQLLLDIREQFKLLWIHSLCKTCTIPIPMEDLCLCLTCKPNIN